MMEWLGLIVVDVSFVARRQRRVRRHVRRPCPVSSPQGSAIAGRTRGSQAQAQVDPQVSPVHPLHAARGRHRHQAG